MTPDQRIDDNIRAFLNDAGLVLHYHEVVRCKPARDAMRKIMSDSYIKGTQDNFDALVASGRLKK